MVGGSLTIPFILFPKLCIEEDDPARGYIISTVFFISGKTANSLLTIAPFCLKLLLLAGLITLMQTTIGVR